MHAVTASSKQLHLCFRHVHVRQRVFVHVLQTLLHHDFRLHVIHKAHKPCTLHLPRTQVNTQPSAELRLQPTLHRALLVMCAQPFLHLFIRASTTVLCAQTLYMWKHSAQIADPACRPSCRRFSCVCAYCCVHPLRPCCLHPHFPVLTVPTCCTNPVHAQAPPPSPCCLPPILHTYLTAETDSTALTLSKALANHPVDQVTPNPERTGPDGICNCCTAVTVPFNAVTAVSLMQVLSAPACTQAAHSVTFKLDYTHNKCQPASYRLVHVAYWCHPGYLQPALDSLHNVLQTSYTNPLTTRACKRVMSLSVALSISILEHP